MRVHKLRWILYTAFFIWTGTENGFRISELHPQLEFLSPLMCPVEPNLASRFVLPFLTSVGFLMPDIIQLLHDQSQIA